MAFVILSTLSWSVCVRIVSGEFNIRHIAATLVCKFLASTKTADFAPCSFFPKLKGLRLETIPEEHTELQTVLTTLTGEDLAFEEDDAVVRTIYCIFFVTFREFLGSTSHIF